MPRQLDGTTLDRTTLGFYSFVTPQSARLLNNRRVSSGTRMRVIAPLFLLCTLSGVASAQTTEQCPPTPRAGDLLNCYNGTAPAHVLRKPANVQSLDRNRQARRNQRSDFGRRASVQNSDRREGAVRRHAGRRKQKIGREAKDPLPWMLSNPQAYRQPLTRFFWLTRQVAASFGPEPSRPVSLPAASESVSFFIRSRKDADAPRGTMASSNEEYRQSEEKFQFAGIATLQSAT